MITDEINKHRKKDPPFLQNTVTWHNLDIEQIFSVFNSSPAGLSTTQAKEKFKEFGYNRLIEKSKKSILFLFVSQFKDFMILVLVVAAIISGITGDRADAIIILVIVFLNALVGFVQEYRADKAMDALKKMATAHTSVLRDGHVNTIDAAELVPGDIVLLEAGDAVPADIRLGEVQGLKATEASLTGESVAVEKSSMPINKENLPLGDRLNMVYKGTHISNGRGKGVVVATGMNTEIGHIAGMLQGKDADTPLQKRMTDFSKKLSYLILIICVILFVVGVLRGEEPVNMLLVALSLAVAAIPEALPALITIALSKSAKGLVKQNVLIKKLTAVETLGSVTIICSDKTGTLTQNKMKVVKTVPALVSFEVDDKFSLLELAMSLNHTVLSEEEQLIGDPTETALVEYIQDIHSVESYNEMREKFSLVAELPFDSDRKYMTTVHRFNNKFFVFSKGAVEAITANLKKEEADNSILVDAAQMSAEGIRVLAFGYSVHDRLPENLNYGELEKDLCFAGLVGMTDPIRKEIPAAIAECKTAGIRTVMITGDHKETAAAIATQAGLIMKEEIVVTGDELSNMSKDDLEEKVERIGVYARVSPRQKLNIVEALQKKQHFVAMTGDGINDAPSLKKANIGIAMGITGTDVSKEAADMILLDDNFSTIIKAVKEGRRIYDNIRKFVKYIMTCNSAEIWTIFLAPFLGLPIPLLPIHILWINLVTDGLPGLALSAEKADKNIMQRPPRKTNESLFAEGIGFHIVWVGLLMAFLTLGTQALAIRWNNSNWQTIVFTVLSFAQLAHVLAVRSDHEFIYKKGLFSNPLLLGAVFLTFVLQLAIIYLPFANSIFKTRQLSFSELMVCISVAVLLFHVVELEKWIKMKRKAYSALV